VEAALRQTRQRTLLDNPVIPFQMKRDTNRLVIVNQAGEPLHPATWGHWFDQHVKAAGLRRIRLHDVRHSAATLLLQAGIPPVVVAGILGHSPAVLLTTYAHALPDAKRDAVDVLAALYRATNRAWNQRLAGALVTGCPGLVTSGAGVSIRFPVKTGLPSALLAVAPTGVDPVTSRFSVVRSTNW
jgi:hypothetical protein